MKVTISKGNMKLGGIPNISLPPGITCAKGVPCFASKQCYAMKSYRQYACVREAWNGNLKLYKQFPQLFFGEIWNYLTRVQPERFRIHVGGDFVDQGYVNQWNRVAQACYFTKFLAYTKKYDLDFSKAPKNLTIIYSQWPGFPCDLDPRNNRMAWMEDPKNPDPKIPKKAKLCPGSCKDCSLCWDLKYNQHVKFHKH